MTAQKNSRIKKTSSAVFILLQAALLFVLFLPFLTGISLGIVLYVLLEPLYEKLMPLLRLKSLTAVFLMLMSFFILVIPIVSVGYLGFLQVIKALSTENISSFLELLPFSFENFKIGAFLQSHLSTIVSYLQSFSASALGSTVNIFLNFFVMYFLVFFLFLRGSHIREFLLKVLPFRKENSQKLIDDGRKLIQSTILSNTAVALSLGILFTIGLSIIGYHDYIFWFSLSLLLSFIPVVGIQIIWIPIGVLLLLQQKYAMGIGIMAYGAFLSFILDGYIRQLAQHRFGRIDPFLSLAGITIGIIYFGIAGIIVGPFLLSLFLQSFQLYQEEFGELYG